MYSRDGNLMAAALDLGKRKMADPVVAVKSWQDAVRDPGLTTRGRTEHSERPPPGDSMSIQDQAARVASLAARYTGEMTTFLRDMIADAIPRCVFSAGSTHTFGTRWSWMDG